MKNKQRKSNEFFTGECDITFYKVRDIKSSWNLDSFPMEAEEIPTKLYVWQLDVYMCLFNYKRSELIYCLVDTPTRLVEDELRRSDWKFNVFNGEGNVNDNMIPLVVEIVSNLIYTKKGLKDFLKETSFGIKATWFEHFIEIPEEVRIKIYKHNYSEERINQMKEMVKLAREYMNDVLLGIGSNALNLKELREAS